MRPGKKQGFLPFLLLIILLLVSLIIYGCSPTGEGIKKYEPFDHLNYWGHSAFDLSTYEGTTIQMDPYQPDFGTYGKTISQNPRIITISHEHPGHNYAERGEPPFIGDPPFKKGEILRGLTPDGDWNHIDRQLENTRIYTVAGTFHGRDLENNKNSIFVFETPRLRLAHLGALAHTLDPETIDHMDRVDVLLIPVGGHHTLKYQDILVVIEQLSPRVVIPMHYRTTDNPDSPSGNLTDFLGLDMPYPIRYLQRTIRLTNLPSQTEIWTMKYRWN